MIRPEALLVSITPEGLVTKILTGIEYPSGHEDGLLVQAHTFHGLAADLRALHERQQAQSTYVPGWHGPGYDAHRQALDRILGERGGLLALADHADAIGHGITSTAGSTAKAKYQFALTINWVLASAAWAIYCAAFTAGASLTWLTAIEAAARTALGQIGQWLIRAIAAAGMGAALVAGTDAAAQGLTIASGYADHFDVESFLMSVAAGAMGGAIGLVTGALAGAAEFEALGTTKLTTGLLGQVLVQGTSGFATQLVMSAAEGHLNTDWGGFVAGATGALSGHAVARHSLTTDRPAPTERAGEAALPGDTPPGDGGRPSTTTPEPSTPTDWTSTTSLLGEVTPGDSTLSYGDGGHVTKDAPPTYEETIAAVVAGLWSTVREKQVPLDAKAAGRIEGQADHPATATHDDPTSQELAQPIESDTGKVVASTPLEPTRALSEPAQPTPYRPGSLESTAGPAAGHHAPDTAVPADRTGDTTADNPGTATDRQPTPPTATHPGQNDTIPTDTPPRYTPTPETTPTSHTAAAEQPEPHTSDSNPTDHQRHAPNTAVPAGPTGPTGPTGDTTADNPGTATDRQPTPPTATHPGHNDTIPTDTPPRYTPTPETTPTSHTAAAATVPIADSPTAAGSPQPGGGSGPTSRAESAVQVAAGDRAAPQIMGPGTPAGVPLDAIRPTDPAVIAGAVPGVPDLAVHEAHGGPAVRSDLQTDTLSAGLLPSAGQYAATAPGHGWTVPAGDAELREPHTSAAAEASAAEGARNGAESRVRSEAVLASILNPQVSQVAAGPGRAEGPRLPSARPAPREAAMRDQSRQEIRHVLSPQDDVAGAGVNNRSVYDPEVIAEVLMRRPLQIWSAGWDPYGFGYRRQAFAQAGVTECGGTRDTESHRATTVGREFYQNHSTGTLRQAALEGAEHMVNRFAERVESGQVKSFSAAWDYAKRDISRNVDKAVNGYYKAFMDSD
ncbi:hypothetical protein [Kitasatospora sp. NPDC059571]|uniref:hypothetical protein n=1 Tax=Kitasatospora sp. NPDC059571 TaxID=3346871 RepID=UPI0036891562